MNYLIELTHPKHYYQYRVVIQELKKVASNNVTIIARDKDVLLNILREENVPYLIYGKHGKSLISKFFILPNLFYTYWKIIRKYKVDIIISKASPYPAILSMFTKVATIIEPDSEVVKLTNKLVAPRASMIITPYTYAIDYGKKHKRFQGFFEDTYLHPKVFLPQKTIIHDLGFNSEEPYFILRFISWNANHDLNHFGFSESEKIELVNILKEKGQVYISAEGTLPTEIEKYRIKIPASKIHHALHFATMYVGDSQSMATESALLGTPAIRYNSFVGEHDMTNFIVLEKEYDLLRNFNNFSEVMDCVKEFLSDSYTKQKWLKKRNAYYNKTEDANDVIYKMILDYKASQKSSQHN